MTLCLTVSQTGRCVNRGHILEVVNMTLSKRGDYVVRSALALALAYPSGQSRKIREVVAEMGVPQTFASQILADLVRAGLASSRAGKDGGYRLARPPEEISLLEVVEAGEGPLRAERCALGDGPCRWEAVCPLHETWRTATEALRDVLAGTTLADLAASDLAIAEGRVTVPADSHRHGGPSLPVADFVQVELGVDALATQLSSERTLSQSLGQALSEAEVLRAELGTLGPRWWPSRVMTSCVATGSLDPAGSSDQLRKGGADEHGFQLAFEAESRSGPVLRGELQVVLAPLDPDRTEVRAEGRLRLALGPDVGERQGERLAQVLLRTFLRRLAQALESGSSGSGVGHRPPRRPGRASGTPVGASRSDQRS
jgi:Rrf2 family protein